MPEATVSKWCLRLPADCSIAAIQGVCDLIREAFGREDRLEIDCSSVDKADVTSIQLLLSTAKTGRAQGRSVVLTSISQTMRNAISRAGFTSEAMIDQHFQHKKDGV
jgi:anti-anti-sigma regulatory factor